MAKQWISLFLYLSTDNYACGTYDELCMSNACVGTTCQANKLATNEVCTPNNDCQSGACRRASFSVDASFVCCESGATKSIWMSSSSGWPNSGSQSFCTSQPDNYACGTYDELCISNACVGTTCQANKLATNKVCTSHNDCILGACGVASFSVDASFVSRESGATKSIWTSSTSEWKNAGNRDFCTSQLGNYACGTYDDLCSSGSCIAEKCFGSNIFS